MRLSTSLSIYVLFVCIGIFAGTAIVLESYDARRESEQAHRLTGLLQSGMVRNVDIELHAVVENVQRTGREIMAFGDRLNDESASRMLGIMVESNPIIMAGAIAKIPDGDSGEWMIYVQRTDSAMVSRQLGGTAYRYTSMPWFTDALGSRTGGWSAPYVDHNGGECLMTTYTQPLTGDDGNIHAVVTADVALTTLSEEVASLKPYAASMSFLLTSDGKIIDIPGYCPDSLTALLPAIEHRLNGVADIDEGDSVVDGREYIYCHSRIPDLDIIVCTVTPYRSILSAMKQLKLPLFVILACGFFVLVIGIYLVVLYATRPLNRLTDAAKRIGDGNFDTVLPPMESNSDLARLRNAMGYMIKSIKGYISEIAEAARIRQRIESELEIARVIQQSMLPPPWPNNGKRIGGSEVSVGALLESAREVSGDMYDYVAHDNYFYFTVADVSGKGVPASLVMSAVRSLFRFAAEECMSPEEIIDKINRHVCDNNTHNMFVTILVGRIDTSSGSLVLSNAGHNPPILISGNECRYIDLAPGLPAGIMDDTVYSSLNIGLVPDDRIFLYTDGLTEAEEAGGAQFGQERLLAEVSGYVLSGVIMPEGLVTYLRGRVAEFAVSPLADDITMLCVGFGHNIVRWMSLHYDLHEIARLAEFVNLTASELSWSDLLSGKINLVLEEAVANVINHSEPSSTDDTIDVKIISADVSIILEISDRGPKFDPLASAPEVDITLSAEDRGIGGLGLFLINQLADSVTYEYINRQNILRVQIKTD